MSADTEAPKVFLRKEIAGDRLGNALRRAAQRVPGPVAERSLAQASAYSAAGTARRHSTEAIPLPDPGCTPGPLRIAPDETWCLRCGETHNPTGYCHRCGSQRGRSVTLILRPDEYYIAT